MKLTASLKPLLLKVNEYIKITILKDVDKDYNYRKIILERKGEI